MEMILLSDIRCKHIGQEVEVVGKLTGRRKPSKKIVAIKCKCWLCGTVVSVAQESKRLKSPGRCVCGNRGKFDLINETYESEQRILLDGFPVFLGGDLIGKLDRVRRRSKIRVNGKVSTAHKTGKPVGKFVIIAKSIERIL